MGALGRARRSRVIFEVFRQEKKGAAFAHAGSVSAPDATFAEVFAHEQYGRRQESVALWVVPRDAIREVTRLPRRAARRRTTASTATR